METVEHHGRTTAYRTVTGDGSGPVTLYVHGSGATHRPWSRQYAPGGPAHPAVALDLSGHGDSGDVTTAPGRETLDAYAEDVVAVARAVDATVLVGNSLGGAVAQWVALETDWDPDALVLAGTGPALPVFDGLLAWLDDDFERAVQFLHGRDRLFHATDESLLAPSREQLRAVGRRVTRRDFRTCDYFDVRERLPAVEAPTLALCGEHDRLTPRRYHETLARELPRGEFAVVPDAAHLAMLERPAAFNRAVEGFLDDAVDGYSAR
ncbi:alpha/beta fold hydrolase [Haloarcula onubensis]|uniref:Alpha/beta hydrolase n=1 Tax=Haloarcula onubensis TaxID=2950539 RepID=A0ABU2FS48_9EURY|nr:alpha/beta hydrolase [Halomicroarcula sp. S3CR25-11]MDS0283234.1 alpha/beta hydrolase [Halomicroarcula sp. S3CR25-11]